MMPRTCTQGGSTGPNSRTYADGDNGSAAENSILLFGVRVTQGNSFRKSASMTDLSQYDQPLPQDSNADAGYASDDVVHASGHSRERKRGIPWTEEEHRLFLLGLQQVGKGDWRGISRNFVKTRTPTQVASHAQKYFLRRHNQNRRRRRSSLFDITATDTVTESSTTMEEGRVHTEPSVPPKYPHYSGFGIGSSSFQMMPSPPLTPVGAKLMRPTRILPVAPSSKMAKLGLREKGQVADSLPASKEKSSSVAFEVMSGKPDTNNMISVA